MTFSYLFGGYRYITLPFGVALTNDMFQRKVDKLLHVLPNVFGIAYDILIVGFDELDR